MASTVLVAHTADVEPVLLERCRVLMWDVFHDMTDEDWEHALGGLHAVALDGGEVVGHASVLQRRLVHRGRALRAGYVEAVGVRPDRRRRGIGAALMAPLERVIRVGYDLGCLGTTDDGMPFYRGRGWLPWRGELFALTMQGLAPTPDERGWILVLPVPAAVPLDLDEPLTIADVRPGDAW